MRGRGIAFLAAVALAALLAGCSDDDGPATPANGEPAVTAAAATANPHNALSLLVDCRVAALDSARLVFGADGGDPGATPFTAAPDGDLRLAALGLQPETAYWAVVEGAAGARTVRSDTVRGTTGALPTFLADNVVIDVAGTPPRGYVATNILNAPDGPYMILFDETGRIVWYRRFPYLTGFSQQLPNGNFGAFVGTSQGYQPTYGYYAEVTPAGEEIARHQAVAPLYTDGHELMLTRRDDGWAAHLYSYELRVTDMSEFNGWTDALIGGHQLLRFGPGGGIEFSWNAWDHMDVSDWIEDPPQRRVSRNADFDHPNSLDLDRDGNYVMSFRDLAEIACIDPLTGAFVWRLGGNNNQFTFVDDTFGDFNGQHSVRVLPDGHLLVYDNGLRHVPPESRAVEYALDTTAMTATQVWEYRHTPAVYTPYTGGVLRRADGNTVVQFAGAGMVVEVDPAGAVQWSATVNVNGRAASLYRLMPTPSLYAYIQP